jgi:hypothetical protein
MGQIKDSHVVYTLFSEDVKEAIAEWVKKNIATSEFIKISKISAVPNVDVTYKTTDQLPINLGFEKKEEVKTNLIINTSFKSKLKEIESLNFKIGVGLKKITQNVIIGLLEVHTETHALGEPIHYLTLKDWLNTSGETKKTDYEKPTIHGYLKHFIEKLGIVEKAKEHRGGYVLTKEYREKRKIKV